MPEDKITYGEGATPIRKEPESKKIDEHATNKDIAVPSYTSAESEILVSVSGLPRPKISEVTELEVDRTRDRARNRVKYSVTGRTYPDTIHEFIQALMNNWFKIGALVIIIVAYWTDNLKSLKDVGILILILIVIFILGRWFPSK